MLILLPVLNEAENNADLLDRIEFTLAGIPHTVCILDDGSMDGTVEYPKRRISVPGHNLHLIRRQKNTRGSQRGSALLLSLLWGLEQTPHGIFVEMDGDLSHRQEELPGGIRMITEATCDVAIACKYMPHSKVLNRP